jgi:hypothetical protein
MTTHGSGPMAASSRRPANVSPRQSGRRRAPDWPPANVIQAAYACFEEHREEWAVTAENVIDRERAAFAEALEPALAAAEKLMHSIGPRPGPTAIALAEGGGCPISFARARACAR